MLFVSEYVAATVATHGVYNITKVNKDKAEAEERESILIASEGFEVLNEIAKVSIITSFAIKPVNRASPISHLENPSATNTFDTTSPIVFPKLKLGDST
jgi:hypothetical protein